MFVCKHFTPSSEVMFWISSHTSEQYVKLFLVLTKKEREKKTLSFYWFFVMWVVFRSLRWPCQRVVFLRPCLFTVYALELWSTPHFLSVLASFGRLVIFRLGSDGAWQRKSSFWRKAVPTSPHCEWFAHIWFKQWQQLYATWLVKGSHRIMVVSTPEECTHGVCLLV